MLDAKLTLRKFLINKRKNLEECLCKTLNAAIVENVKTLLENLQYNEIGLYSAIKGEPNLLEIVDLYPDIMSLPKVKGKDMVFCSYKPGQALVRNSKYDFSEPSEGESTLPDLIITPGLGFSLDGYRIGFGGGYYDRYFDKVKTTINPIIIGVCFHDFLLEKIPYDKQDHKVNYIVTDKLVIKI